MDILMLLCHISFLYINGCTFPMLSFTLTISIVLSLAEYMYSNEFSHECTYVTGFAKRGLLRAIINI